MNAKTEGGRRRSDRNRPPAERASERERERESERERERERDRNRPPPPIRRGGTDAEKGWGGGDECGEGAKLGPDGKLEPGTGR